MGQNPDEKQPEKKPDPWGRNNIPPQGPPDLDVLLNKLKAKIQASLKNRPNLNSLGNNKNNNNGGNNGGPFNKPPSTSGTAQMPPSNILFTLIAAVILIIWGLSGIFIISPSDRAVITQFGRYTETLGPGPHWIPRFIQAKQILNVQRISNYEYNSEMLTKDENIVSVAVAVQYRIDDAKDFLFKVVDPIRSLEQATASALRQVVGHNTLDDLLTTGRSQVREQVAKQLQEILGSYATGIIVTDVTLQSIKPPEAVTAAFDDAIKAREDQQAFINKADAYANQVIAAAQGQVARILSQANAYKQEVVLEAQASTAGYLALLPEYRAAPQVMRQRLYLSAMETILGQTSKIFLDQKNGNPLLYLPLDKITATSATPGLPATETTSTSSSAASSSTQAANALNQTINSDVINALSARPSYATGGR